MNKYSCNMENAKFIDKDDDILIETNFMEDRNISVIAKGTYCTLAAFQNIKPLGMTIDEIEKTCTSTKNEIEKAIRELLNLGLLREV